MPLILEVTGHAHGLRNGASPSTHERQGPITECFPRELGLCALGKRGRVLVVRRAHKIRLHLQHLVNPDSAEITGAIAARASAATHKTLVLPRLEWIVLREPGDLDR